MVDSVESSDEARRFMDRCEEVGNERRVFGYAKLDKSGHLCHTPFVNTPRLKTVWSPFINSVAVCKRYIVYKRSAPFLNGACLQMVCDNLDEVIRSLYRGEDQKGWEELLAILGVNRERVRYQSQIY